MRHLNSDARSALAALACPAWEALIAGPLYLAHRSRYSRTAHRDPFCVPDRTAEYDADEVDYSPWDWCSTCFAPERTTWQDLVGVCTRVSVVHTLLTAADKGMGLRDFIPPRPSPALVAGVCEHLNDAAEHLGRMSGQPPEVPFARELATARWVHAQWSQLNSTFEQLCQQVRALDELVTGRGTGTPTAIFVRSVERDRSWLRRLLLEYPWFATGRCDQDAWTVVLVPRDRSPKYLPSTAYVPATWEDLGPLDDGEGVALARTFTALYSASSGTRPARELLETARTVLR